MIWKPSLASSRTRCDCSVFFENVRNLFQRRHFGDDPLLQQQADLIDHHQLAGVGNRYRQLAVGSLFQRHEVVAEHQLRGKFLEQLMMQLEVGEIYKLAAIAPRHVLGTLQVGDRIPVVTTCPPFSPCTKSDFFSAIAISHIPENKLLAFSS